MSEIYILKFMKL